MYNQRRYSGVEQRNEFVNMGKNFAVNRLSCDFTEMIMNANTVIAKN